MKAAVRLDFSDENGRRKVFEILHTFILPSATDWIWVIHVVIGGVLVQDIPENLIGPCIDLLKETTPDEKELIRIGVEIINELRDTCNTISANGSENQSVSTRSS